jgi:hypothetical protein
MNNPLHPIRSIAVPRGVVEDTLQFGARGWELLVLLAFAQESSAVNVAVAGGSSFVNAGGQYRLEPPLVEQ